MDDKTKIQPKKEYTILKEPVNLKYGLGTMTNSAMFACACQRYSAEFIEERDVLVSNVTRNPGNKVKGASPTSILAILNAHSGDLLEIQIEGTDDYAKAFAEKLKRGLNEENYLYEQWKSR